MFCSRDLFWIDFGAPVVSLGDFGEASGRPRATKGGPGKAQGAILALPRALQKGAVFALGGLWGTPRGLLDRFWIVCLRCYRAKLQF